MAMRLSCHLVVFTGMALKTNYKQEHWGNTRYIVGLSLGNEIWMQWQKKGTGATGRSEVCCFCGWINYINNDIATKLGDCFFRGKKSHKKVCLRLILLKKKIHKGIINSISCKKTKQTHHYNLSWGSARKTHSKSNLVKLSIGVFKMTSGCNTLHYPQSPQHLLYPHRDRFSTSAFHSVYISKSCTSPQMPGQQWNHE